MERGEEKIGKGGRKKDRKWGREKVGDRSSRELLQEEKPLFYMLKGGERQTVWFYFMWCVCALRAKESEGRGWEGVGGGGVPG